MISFLSALTSNLYKKVYRIRFPKEYDTILERKTKLLELIGQSSKYLISFDMSKDFNQRIDERVFIREFVTSKSFLLAASELGIISNMQSLSQAIAKFPNIDNIQVCSPLCELIGYIEELEGAIKTDSPTVRIGNILEQLHITYNVLNTLIHKELLELTKFA